MDLEGECLDTTYYKVSSGWEVLLFLWVGLHNAASGNAVRVHGCECIRMCCLCDPHHPLKGPPSSARGRPLWFPYLGTCHLLSAASQCGQDAGQ